ncbi:hypothetical protein ZOSMA_21G00620 [Zostera marina]|uniref:DYW domain-containing protein n=1 Tax=Zostera marina TaxID=29655 RepID=A0A0K9PJH3_ZOSMR|nr:hypothetical protein ZOSMA_21G00620 [Zostera marina]
MSLLTSSIAFSGVRSPSQTKLLPINNPNYQILRFCQTGNLTKAVQSITQLDPFQRTQLDSAAYCSVIQLCAEQTSLLSGKKVHSVISSSGVVDIDEAIRSKLVFMYVKCGDLQCGRRVFDDGLMVSSPALLNGPFCWSFLINEYAKIGEFEESLSLFTKVRSLGAVEMNSYVFTCVLKCVAALQSEGTCRQFHGLVMKSGFGDDTISVNSLISSYFKCRLVEEAFYLFDRMLMKDLISWNTVINESVSNGQAYRAVGFLNQMSITGIDMDSVTVITGVLPICSQLRLISTGKTIHGYSIKNGFMESEPSAPNSLIMYSKCQDFESAIRVSEKMNCTHRTVATGSFEHGKYVHDYITREGVEFNLFASNGLINMYSKSGRIKDARNLFDGMIEKDIVSWNTMIGAYSKNHLPNEAIQLFQKMTRMVGKDGTGIEVEANHITMACILPAVASLSSLDRGKEIHGQILRKGWQSFISNGDKGCILANALIDMYAKCGEISSARRIFDMVVDKDIVSWTAMIAGYGIHGNGKETIALFKKMKRSESNPAPTEVFFLAVLYACGHSCLVDEGWVFFDAMRNDYNIEPSSDHYLCMVELLCRSGYVRKAWKFVLSMPKQPSTEVWTALLSGCRIHRDVKLAEKITNHISVDGRNNGQHSILLGNIYKEAEKWETVKKLKEQLGLGKEGRRGHRREKMPECSWVDVKKKTHIFISDESSVVSPAEKKVKDFLVSLRSKMEETRRPISETAEGVNNTKEVCGHSELLAIGFGVLNSGNRRPIRVAKNIETCVECHTFVKFMSSAVGREIILRDCHRFHHFINGRCSCRGAG